MTCSFMRACVRCLTLVDTNVLLLYALYCSDVQGRLKAVLLFLLRSLVCAFVVCAEDERQIQNESCSISLCGPRRRYS